MGKTVIQNKISVVESGSGNGWQWRKYSDGTAKMWGVFGGTVSPYWTGGGYGGYRMYISYPSGLTFTEAPVASFTCSVGGGFTMPGTACIGNQSAYRFECVAYSTAQQPNVAYTISLQAVGLWK